MNKIEISGRRGTVEDEFNYTGSQNDYIYLDVEKIAKKIIKEENNEIIEKIKKDIEEQIKDKQKDIKESKERLRKAIYELAYYVSIGAEQYNKIMGDDIDGEDIELINCMVHHIIKPLVNELYDEKNSIDIREIHNRTDINEFEMLEEYLDILTPKSIIKDKNNQHIYQNKLEQYDLKYIAQKLNDMGYYQNIKTCDIKEVIDFLQDAKKHNFGINVFIDTYIDCNPKDSYLVLHVPETHSCHDVYNTSQIIDAVVTDRHHLGKVLYTLEGDFLDDFLKELEEDECKNCYWYILNDNNEDMICSNTGEVPWNKCGCKDFHSIK